MKFRGKIIGALTGLLIAGPIGLVFGFIAGHLYDIGYFNAFLQAVQGNIHTQSQQIFFNATFKVMGYVAKSDGRISENEIQTARMIMSRMGLNEALKQQAIELFSQGKEPNFNLHQTLSELQQACEIQPPLLRIFLDIQLQMANADGILSPAKKAALQFICEKLGIQEFQFQERGNQYQHTHQDYRQSANSTSLSTDEAYRILEINASATADEIKKAYRRAMSQNHPDKLIAKGLPPEMIKMATQKTQRIKEAYELITGRFHQSL